MTLTQLLRFQATLAAALLATAGAQTDKKEQSLSADREEALRVQLFLDQSPFKPGIIDAQKGKFTTEALKRWHEANGGKKSDDPKTLPLDKVGELYAEYQIKEEDQQHIGSVPKDPEQMSKEKKIAYRSLLEFVAERFHCDEELLGTLNPGKDLKALKPGDTVVVPNVKPFEIEKIAAEGKEDVTVAGDKESKVEVHVNTSTSLLELREDDKLVGSYPITPGSDEKGTPKGTWEVKFMAQMPTYKWDTKMFKGEGKGGEEGKKYTIPPGVNNPVGVIWMQLTPEGVGMHGTPEPETIGRAGSHGCIRLSNWDAIDLSSKIAKGTKVVIE